MACVSRGVREPKSALAGAVHFQKFYKNRHLGIFPGKGGGLGFSLSGEALPLYRGVGAKGSAD